MMRRLTLFLLTIVMALGIFPLNTAFASTSDDRKAVLHHAEYYEAGCTQNADLSDGGGNLPDSVPQEYNELFTAAANKFSVPPALLTAIFLVENNGKLGPDTSKYKFPAYKRKWTAVSSAGAQGPFQFLPGTWATNGVDGNKDGEKDIHDIEDASYGAAKYLASLGGKVGASNAKIKAAAGGYEAGHPVGDSDYANSAFPLYQKYKEDDSLASASSLSPGNIVSSALAADSSSSPGTSFGPQYPKVEDADALAKSIDEYIKKTAPSSPLNGMGEEFVDAGAKYNINPALIVAIAQKESTLGLAIPGGSFNSYGRTATSSQPNVSAAGRLWYKYDSFRGSIAPQTKYVHDVYIKEKKLKTIKDIMFAYAPPGDGNDTTGYIKFIDDVLKKILDGVATPGSETSDEACAESSSASTAGVNGFDLTGPHAMVSYDQTDPKWSNKPYGKGKSSIGESGCGPTSIAMVGATLLGDKGITPLKLANKYGDEYHVEGGSDHRLMEAFAKDYKLKSTEIGTNLNKAADTIKAGGLVVMLAQPGYFTGSGHFLVIRAISDDGKSYYLADPNGDGIHHDSEKRAFSAEFLKTQGGLSDMWTFTK